MAHLEANDPKANGIDGVQTKDGDAGGVRSVQRAFALLRCLSADRPKATLTEFTQLTGLATSTVQRLLNTLEADDILRRLPDGRYSFGSAMLQIGVSALEGVELYGIVEPQLEALSAATDETTNFGILNRDGDVLYLRQTPSPRAIRHASWLGRAFAAEGTAIGAALKGKTDADGLVITRKTLEPDVTAIATPIYGPGDAIVAGISITGPSYRIDDATLVKFGALLIGHARSISAQIGGRWRTGDEAPGTTARGDAA